jgi:hypothetical protein
MISIESEVGHLNIKLKDKELELLKVDTTLSNQWSSIDIELPLTTDTDARNKLKTLIKKSVNKITFNRIAKSHFNIKFEFVNGHVREVELKKGELDWGNFSHRADVDMIYTTTDNNISKTSGLTIPTIHNLPIEKDEL